MNAPDSRALKYMRQKLILQGEIDKSNIIVGHFNTFLLIIDVSSRLKISKTTDDLNSTINQLELIDIYRTFHETTAKYTFFSSSHVTFWAINKFKIIEVIQNMFSYHNGIRLEINAER